jgi:hypothetical protein
MTQITLMVGAKIPQNAVIQAIYEPDFYRHEFFTYYFESSSNTIIKNGKKTGCADYP